MRNEEKNLPIRSSAAEYLTFVAATGNDEQSVEMRYENENIWLTQKMMAALYEVEVQTEGNRQVEREIKHYNLKMRCNNNAGRI